MRLASNIFRKLVFTTILVSLLSTQVIAQGETLETLADFKPALSDKFIALLSEATAEQGEIIFMRKCSSCHDHEQAGGHGKGPHLWNLLGRKAGSIAGFDFSTAMSNSGHTWTLATVNYYLTNTEKAVPGRIMEFRGIRRDKVRARLLKYLIQFNDNPPLLPR